MDGSWDESICVEKKITSKETILDELRQRGCRITKKRKLIIDIILKNECASCKEIYWEAVKADPSVGIATVYRTLRCLEEIGVIDRKNLYKISHDYTDCLKCECTVVLKDKSLCRLSGELWGKAVNKALSELCVLDPKDVESVLLKKTADSGYDGYSPFTRGDKIKK